MGTIQTKVTKTLFFIIINNYSKKFENIEYEGVFFMKNKTIIFIKNKIINDKTTLDVLSKSKNKKLGLDMSCVETIYSNLFVVSLFLNKFNLFNLKNEVLIYLSLILKENNLKSYVNEFDFQENKRELVRRKFFIASST